MSQSRRISGNQPTPAEAAGRGRGRGRGGGGGGPAGSGRGAPSVPVARPPVPALSSAPSPVPAIAMPTPSPSTVASSSSAPVPVSAYVSVPVEALTSGVEKLAVQPPPESSKAVRFPGRPGYGTVGMKIQVRANHFLVEVADRDCHHYDVSITPEVLSKGVNRAIIDQLVKLYQKTNLGNRMPVYDGRKSLYTAGPLPFQSQDFVVQLADDEKHKGSAASSSSGSTSKKRDREFKVTIRFASKPDIHHLQMFLKNKQPDNPQEAIQALDIALRASPSEKYNISGRSFFSPLLGNTGTLGSGTEYWRGYYQSLRPTQMGLSLNINVSARAYYEPILVTEFIAKYLNANLSRPLSDRDRVKLKKALRGVKVKTSHAGYDKSLKVAALSREPLGQLMFPLDDKKTKISVVQYFREKYQIELKYSNLPAFQFGSDERPVYVPMEVCRIADGQRFSKKLNEGQVQALLKANCQRPNERENYIRQIVRQNNFNTDKYANEFGIKVKEELALVEARVLPPPMLKYHDSGKEKTVNPSLGQWNMINKKMHSGGTVRYWSCLNFSRNRDLPFHFSEGLANMCTSKGMFFNPEPLIPITSAQPNQIEKALKDVHEQSKAKLAKMKQEGKLELLIIILPEVKGSYGKVKRICETDLGIVSQCVQPGKASKMQVQYLENVALKINVKAGGRNMVLEDAARSRMPLVSDRPTMILGADVTHPQPGEDSSPSIAAVVGSMDWPLVTKYRGIVSAQNHREEIIQDLYKTYQDPKRGTIHAGMIRELLKSFYISTKRKPDRIIFYRDGVSEGQFSQVLLHEMDAIRKACVSLEETYLPRVTFVVVQKRHHTRLFPADHRSRNQTDRSGNILPGTVVDTKICHPREFDFYLNSHAGIQGTSRPTHYHVLYDENSFTADTLQTLTNNLCYTYARCTRSVSIVPPAYYAHLAAFRARSYIEGEIEGGDSGSRGDSANRTTNVMVTLPAIKDDVKDVMFYC